MPTVLQFRRGTTAQNNSFTGSAGELSIDTDLEIIRVHDGSAPGGFPLVGANSTQTLLNKTLSNVVISGTITANGGVGSSGQYLESTATGVRWSSVDSTTISNGTSSMSVIASGGNIRGNISGSTISTLYSGGMIVTGVLERTGNSSLGNISTNGAGLVVDPGTFTDTTSSGTVSVVGIHTIGQPTLSSSSVTTFTNAATLYIANAVATGSNSTLTNRYALYVAAGASGFGGDIVNLQANGVGNIGSASTYFNTVFAKATSAQYADLAEKYTADADYPPGTVVSFGGSAEITVSKIDHDASVAGVISTDPAFVMNTGLDNQYVATVALAGRVPCRVKGIIAKGDRLVSSDIPGVAERLDMARYQPGCIIGKALEAHDSAGEGQIEVVVGRV